MILGAAVLFSLVLSVVQCSPEEAEHRDFQYNSVVDPSTGRYNFAYDTGHDNEIAHSLHMQYKDADGIVRGRYGYTDPRGNLRMVEYEAGPNGFVARGDVGPDLFPHGQAPAPTSGSVLSGYTDPTQSGNDFNLDPAPVQMAGWDPEIQPMDQPLQDSVSDLGQPLPDSGVGQSLNVTRDDAMVLYGPELGFYPRLTDTELDTNDGRQVETESLQLSPDTPEPIPIQENNELNIYNIDVDPDEIRSRAGGPVRRSADNMPAPAVKYSVKTKPVAIVQEPIDTKTISYVEPVLSKPIRFVQEHIDTKPIDTKTVSYVQPIGRKPIPVVQEHIDTHPVAIVRKSEKVQVDQYQPSRAYYYPRHNHDHDAETRYYRARQTHDHDAERYYRPRQTHDHDAELRRYRARQTHDHDAEARYYRARQTHDHDAELRRYRARQTHDHDAEKTRYYSYGRYTYPRSYSYGGYTYPRSYSYGRSTYPRRIFYRDSHSMEPHEHASTVYRNHNDHQHSDVHLYGKSRNYVVPATAKPRELQYIPSDKYHDKKYYWTSS